MPRRLGDLAAPLLTAALVFFCALAWTQPAEGGVFGALVTVTTTSDNNTSNLFCSLRQAINATNQNIKDHGCDGTNGSSTVPDSIVFLQKGLFNVLTPLPAIANGPLSIDGEHGVELHGPGGNSNFDGLTIAASAPGTSISNLVIDNFDGSGIVIEAEAVLVTGNFIGTNVAGDTAAGNNTAGIYIKAAGAHIGGTNGTTPGGPCTGDCNLLSANGFGGMFTEAGATGTVVEGNFAGTDVTGNVAIPNGGWGVYVGAASMRVGGTSAAARNVISGNSGGTGRYGIRLRAGAVVEGNYIGTNAAGDVALPNDVGIYDEETTGALIGGTSAGARNVISGNNGAGIEIDGAEGNDIFGNFIGAAADGTSPLPNAEGVRIYDGSANNLVGGTGNGEGNEIAFNRDPGVVVSGDPTPTSGDPIRGNSIHDNDPLGISNEDGGNLELAPPVINSVGAQFAGQGVSGTACANCEVDVYSDDAGQGRIYEGTVTAGGDGVWVFNAAVAGPNVTATANDSLDNTSEFSEPFTVLAATPTPSPTPSPSPSPTLSPTPTLTPTPSPTPTATPVGQTPSPTPTQTLIWGDTDCGGDIAPRDGQAILKNVLLQNALSQTEPCPDVGSQVIVDGVSRTWGDVDCNGDIAPRDGQAILKNVLLQNALSQTDPCPDVGSTVQVVG